MQSEDQRLPRSEYFIKQRLAEKNKAEDADPYLKILRSRNDLHITSTEYYSFSEDDYLY